MAQILKPKIKATGLMDAFEMGILKTVSERALNPVVGNSTLTSGAVKLVAGGILPSISRNKHVGLLSSAMVIDGVEDAAHSILSGLLGSGGESGGSDW